MEHKSKIISLVYDIWRFHPTMRFFQLLDWLKHEYSSRHGYGRREGYETGAKGDKQPYFFIDLYYLEDKEFEEFLLTLISEQHDSN
ncbi:hypothetical protein AB1K91_14970 [Terribacillus sp. 179-K 1B1 HS]|uniref:hypothetical protein n=1 Tax=Terribacillus sp. 179-K 1B1 HS TaxID=3142388 RepID=UPI0039A36AD3